MSVATEIGIIDLITIHECIEILVNRRTARDRMRLLSPAAAEELGTTHVVPRAWTDEAKGLLRQGLMAGEIGLYASRKVRDGRNIVSDNFVRIPSEMIGQSVAFRIALPAETLFVRTGDSLVSFHGSEIRIRRSELDKWLRRHRRLFDRTKFRRRSPRRPKPGNPGHKRGLAINVVNWLYPPKAPPNKKQHEVAREVVATIAARFGESISLTTAKRAVAWVFNRRSARM